MNLYLNIKNNLLNTYWMKMSTYHGNSVSSQAKCSRFTEHWYKSRDVRSKEGLKGWRPDCDGILLSEDSSTSFQAPESGHADLFYVGRAWQAGGGLRSDCKTWKRNMLNILIQSCQEIPWPTTSLVSAPVSINVGHYSLSGFASLGKNSSFGNKKNSLKSRGKYVIL